MWQLLGVRLLLLFIQWWFIKPHIINQAPGCQDTADSSAFDSISANHSVQHKVTPWTVHRSVTDKPPSTPTLMCQISQEWTGTQMSSLGGNRSSGFTKWEPPGGAQKIGKKNKKMYIFLFLCPEPYNTKLPKWLDFQVLDRNSHDAVIIWVCAPPVIKLLCF